MGNEGSRMNRGSSFRRRNSKSGQHYIAGKIIKNIWDYEIYINNESTKTHSVISKASFYLNIFRNKLLKDGTHKQVIRH